MLVVTQYTVKYLSENDQRPEYRITLVELFLVWPRDFGGIPNIHTSKYIARYEHVALMALFIFANSTTAFT